jgi:RNA polymerase sigma-70 factor (ECF subfamily)
MATILDDHRLIERLRARDETAVADLAARYRSKIYQLAFRYMKNREDAEEVAQDVLLKVSSKAGAFRGESALSSWIYRITFNTAMSRLRSVRAARRNEVDDHPTSALAKERGDATPRRAEFADWSTMGDEHLLRAQLRQKLNAALREMPGIYRAPVLLRDLHGYTTEEASAILRVKDQTLKSRLHRGRLFLRDRLSEFADGLSLHRPLAASASRGAEAASAA